MMAFFNTTKRSKLATAFLLILTLVVSYAIPMTVYATPPPTPTTTTNFNVNLFNYDQATVNGAARNLNPKPSDNKILTFFGGNSSENPVINRAEHSICHESVYTGIVEDELNSSGMPVYASGIRALSLFELGNAKYKSYANVAFPFTYDGSYYEYDSTKNSATLNAAKNKINLGSVNGGFWPFEKIGESEDFHFGMSMYVDFFVPKNRLVNGNHMIFTFSGDDDVWVFVDDKLVLDLGGIHGIQGGSIDFTDGTITNPANYPGRPNAPTKLRDVFGKDWDDEVFNEFSSHTLKVFYLERGAGQSNLKIKFNVPRVEPLTVEKKLADVNPGFTTDDEFRFVLQTAKYMGYYQNYAHADYDVYQGSEYLRSAETNDQGVFTLKAGEKAVFSDIKHGRYLQVFELDTDECVYNDETWQLPDPNNQDLVVIADKGKDKVKGRFSYDAKAGDFALVCLNNMNTVDVTFEKRDGSNRNPVSGAAFILTAVNGVLGSAVTSSNEYGIVTFPDIPKGEYTLQEIGAPTGYLHSDEIYYVTVDCVDEQQPQVSTPRDGGEKCPPPVQECELGFEIRDSKEAIVTTILNEQKLIDLTIEKLVRGSHAPVDNEENGTTYYDFTIFYHDGYDIDDPWNVASTGAIFNGPITGVSLDQDDSNSGFGFSLPAGGSITIPIQEGVHYEVYENVPDGADFDTYFMQTGNEADGLKGDGIASQMFEKSVLTVLNQYGNDGLTVLKLVDGNQAPEEGNFDFIARFWTPESERVMEANLIGGAETMLGKAQAARDEAYASMSALDWTSLGAVQQGITDAGVSVAAASVALDIANDELDEANADLDEANASKAAIQEKIDATTDSALIADLEDQILALGIDDLEDDVEAAEAAAAQAQEDYENALEDQADAVAALVTLKADNAAVKAYLDAEDALAAAQAEYDDTTTNKEENIFERIWNRIIGFFRGLVVGETYEMGVTDVVCSGTAIDFVYDSTTSECAFSLGIADSITFNFDQYFADHPDVDKIFFEITEIGDGGAGSVNISTEGDELPDSAYGESPTITNNTIKGYVVQATEDPTIVYTNDFGDIFWREYTVIHETNTGTELASDTALGIIGEPLNLNPEDFSGYSYTTVSAVGMAINPDDGGNISDVLPDYDETESSIVITYVYTPDPTDDDDDTPTEKHRGSTATTINEEETPAAPVTPEAVSTPVTSVIEEEVPAAPLPATGGVAPYLIYGLGLLLAGGGVAMKARSKKDKTE